MGRYSIKELEQLSGIKAHTIRIWEKRYNIVTPSRTDTNIRFYSDEDLKKIINVSLLNSNGIKISHISQMSSQEISSKILELSQSHDGKEVHIEQLIVSMIELDELKFESTLDAITNKYGFENTILEIVYPFLEKIGILWQTKNINPAQEHFISNLIRQKIIVAIDSLPLPNAGRKKVLLFLPENELHEIGLLFYHYIVRKAGFKTFYLGASVPYPDLLEIAKIHNPDILITSMTSSIGEAADSYLTKLANDFPDTVILATGYQTQNLNPKKIPNVKIFANALNINSLILSL